MDVWWIGDDSASRRSVDEIRDLLGRNDGWLWVDIPSFDPEAERLLGMVLNFHPRAVQDCAQRNHVPKVHAYPDHLFLVVHCPEVSEGGGHVHYVELDQFVGTRYLVTLHGPLNPAVPLETALRQTGEAAQRLETGRLRPASPYALSYAIVSSIVRRPAPRCKAALAMRVARRLVTVPERGGATVRTFGAVSSAASSAVPPWG